MNLSDSPNLKSVRDVDEHQVLNMFAPTGELKKGTFVALVNTNSGNTNLYISGNSPKTPYQTVTGDFGSRAPSYAYSRKGEVMWKVKQATTTDPVLGVLLYDVKDTNAFGENYRFLPPSWRHEQQVSLVGESTPILTRGMICTNGFHNTPIAGSGAIVSGGKLFPQVYSKSTSVGMFLSSQDAQGYALFWVSTI